MNVNFSAAVIAQFVDGDVIGNPDITANDISDIVDSREGTLCFVGDKKYLPYLADTKASIVLISQDIEPVPTPATLIRVANARVAVSKLLQMVADTLHPRKKGVEQPCFIAEGVEVPDDSYIGAFACVAKNVRLGKGVQIYPHVYIGENVKIGDNTILYSGVKVYYNCEIGNNCIIHSGAVIGADGFGFEPDENGVYHKVPQIGNVVIGSDIEVGANSTIDRAMMGTTYVGDNSKIDNLVQLGHNVQIGKSTVLCAQVGIAGSTNVGNHCTLTGQVGVAGHISVCDNVVVGAQSGIPNNIKQPGQYMGSPAIPASQWRRMVVVQKNLPELQRIVYKEIKK